MGAVVRFKIKQQVIGVHAAVTRHHHDAQWVVMDDSVQLFQALFGKVIRNVHGEHSFWREENP
ncbi:hypothetical protein BFN10_01640 [Pseudomonas extremorientalis]|uniref:Uncharacterized protein n=1 Tax=Pseudomonas extremorientalis TaxID=169669 RepID=A0A1S2TST0_9PSED|nr:hypothetical protein BFN10_01640 [Pseudomonas extremorientalis]